uniref:molybdopterin molybdotransferase n=1 Tax=Romanomermis culicivorax TaxID=13658 RepID=A0A915JF31_ROMCU
FSIEQCAILRDERKSIIEALSRALDQNDVIVTTGGVSMGDKDFMKDVLVQDLHCEIHFGRLFMKPGKPTTFATCDWKGRNRWIFALPGNPVSAWVVGHLLVIPALKRLSAFEKANFSRIKVRLANDRWNLDFRPEYVRAALIVDNEDEEFHHFKAYISEENQTSSRLLSNKNANLFIEMPKKTTVKSQVVKNEILNALLIGHF